MTHECGTLGFQTVYLRNSISDDRFFTLRVYRFVVTIKSRTTFQGVQHQGTLPTTHHGLLLRFQLRLRERHVHMCRQVRVLRLLHVLVRGLLVHL